MRIMANLLIETIKDVTVVTFRDRNLTDPAEIDRVGGSLIELVEKQDKQRIVLDFHEVQALSSLMLGVLLTLKKRLDERGGRVIVCGVSRELRRVFELTALHKIFQFATDADDGLMQFGVVASS
jgi:anti-sigma B factor antagonist